MNDKGARAHTGMASALAIAAGILGLFFVGAWFPQAATWGIHHLAFLGPLRAFAVLGVAAALVAWLWKLDGLKRAEVTSPLLPSHLGPVLAVFGVLALLAVVFRSSVPVLGDGYTLLNNINRALAGEHRLTHGNEPGSIAVFYVVAGLLGASGSAAVANAILVTEVFLLAAFVVMAIATGREFFPSTGDARAFMVAISLVTIPALQLFFGYVEVYSVVLTASAVTLWCSIRHVRGKLGFAVLPAVFLLLCLVHYLGVLYLPLLVLLAVGEGRARGWRTVASGFAIAAGAGIAVVLAFGPERFIPVASHSHLLPVVAIDDEYTAYTLFSLPHLIDVLNLLALASGPIALAVAGRRTATGQGGDRLGLALVAVIIPAVLFVLVAKFDLGMAKDWDLTAPLVYPLALFGAWRFLAPGVGRIRPMAIVLVAAFVPTAAAIMVNADREATLRRVRTLVNTEFMSPGGAYQAAVHLSSAYIEGRQVDSMAAIWEEYLRIRPADHRGYQKLAKSLWEKGEPGYGEVIGVLARWDSASGGDPSVRLQVRQFCRLAGGASLRAGRYGEARDRFSRVVAIDARDTLALNGLGEAELGLRDSASAIRAFRMAADAGSSIARERLERLPPSR